MKLTDTACKNAKPKDKNYKLFDGGGLYLEIASSGSKYWRLKYRHNNIEKRLAFGTYPIISLKEAREKRDIAKNQIMNGLDPSSEKKKAVRLKQAESENSFEKIALEWLEHQSGHWTARNLKTIRTRLENDLFPVIGSRPITEIEAPDILAILRQIEKRGAYEVVSRIRRYCSQVFRFGIVTGKASRDPAQDIQGALKPYKKGHHAAIDINEIPTFLKSLERNDARLYRHTQLAVKMLMLTFVRTSEMIEATWDEFDLENKQWVIPAERMKMNNPHIVPLSSQVLNILTELKDLAPNSSFIFPSQVGHRKHMSNNTVTKALERLGYKGKQTGHGFRALALSTIKEKLGYQHDVVDRQLAHAPRNAVDRAYDRAKFLDQRKIMMQEWADYLDGLK